MRGGEAQGIAECIATEPLIQPIAAEQKRIAGIHLQFQHIQDQLLGSAYSAGQSMSCRMVLGLL